MLLLSKYEISHKQYPIFKETIRRCDNPEECLHLHAVCLSIPTPGDEVLTVVYEDIVSCLQELASGILHDHARGAWPAKTARNMLVSVYVARAKNKQTNTQSKTKANKEANKTKVKQRSKHTSSLRYSSVNFETSGL